MSSEPVGGHDLEGHRPGRLGPSPFAHVAGPLAAGVAYVVAAIVWAVAGDLLPGDRWLLVHLFTLGILTNVVLAFSEHFGRTLTRGDERRPNWQTWVLQVFVVTTLIGLPGEWSWAVAVGGAGTTAVVGLSWARLRRLRATAPQARFAWIVRAYERAHEAFVAGSLLGMALGMGLLPGAWSVSARFAHLHVNVLGWGGLTLLATIVFFGPTVVRTQMVPGADRRARPALWAATAGLAVGGAGLLLSGTDGSWWRWLAAAGLAVYAGAAAVVMVPVMVAAVRAKPSAPRWHLAAVGAWFPVVSVADAVVVATGRWRLLDALGIAMLLGVLFQAIVMVAAYVAPLLRGRSFGARDVLLARLEVLSGVRTAGFNLGAVLLVAATAAGTGSGDIGSVGFRVGLALVVVAVVEMLAVGLWPLPDTTTTVRSRVARRYRE